MTTKNKNRVVVLERPYSKSKVDSWLSNLDNKKCFDSDKFAGKIIWDEDPLAFQKRLRNEWE